MQMLPEGWSAETGPVCVGFEDYSDVRCGEPAEFVGASGEFSGCFCARCAEIIGDLLDEWRQIG